MFFNLGALVSLWQKRITSKFLFRLNWPQFRPAAGFVRQLDHREVGAGAEVIQHLHLAGRDPPSPQAPSSRRPAAATPPRRAGAVEKHG